MRYCKKCVYPDTMPGIFFDERGVCGACLYEEEKKKIDWDAREKELAEIAGWAKATTKSAYDCVVGVSGGKDSTFQAVYCRDRLGLKPLLVNSEPENITPIGRMNIENLKQLGFDVISLRPNPVVMRKLVRRSFYEYGNPAKITEYSLTASAYIVAKNFGIPLIVQGENDAIALGVRNDPHLAMDGNAMDMNKLNTQRTPLSEFTGKGVTERDLFLFRYDREKMLREGFKGVWLQYYAKEWSSMHNVKFALKRGFRIRPKDFNPYEYGTYCACHQIDSDIWPMNMLLKHLKFGYGQCTDHAGLDIRSKQLSREEAIELVKRYDGRCGEKFLLDFCQYIGITLKEFWRVADTYRGPMWKRDRKGEWALKDPVWEQEPPRKEIDASRLLGRLYVETDDNG